MTPPITTLETIYPSVIVRTVFVSKLPPTDLIYSLVESWAFWTLLDSFKNPIKVRIIEMTNRPIKLNNNAFYVVIELSCPVSHEFKYHLN